MVNGGGTTIDLIGIPDSRIAVIEYIDLTGSGNNTLTLTLTDVLALTSNTLLIFGNSGDVVRGGVGWTPSGSTTMADGPFNVYIQSNSVVLVDADITQIFG